MGKSFQGSGCKAPTHESTEVAGVFWAWGMAPHPLSRAAEGVLHACVHGDYRWQQPHGAAGTEADGAKARTGARTGGGLHTQLTPATAALSSSLRRATPVHRVGPFLGCSQSCSRAGPRGLLCRQAFPGPRAASWDARGSVTHRASCVPSPWQAGDVSHAIHRHVPGALLLKDHLNPRILLKPLPSPIWTLQWPLTACCLPLTPLLVQLTAIFAG